MNVEDARRKLIEYFSEKLETHGPTARGVDYNGPEAQRIRFEQLVRVIDLTRPFTVIDYGCGYGALFEFLNERASEFEYYGIDWIEKMVAAGRAAHAGFPNAHFTTDERQAPVADYLLAGAVFNIKLEAPYEEWQQFICETLKRMDASCSKGFAFNMLTNYSDADRMAARPDLFHGDPRFFFDFCKQTFSRDVALLHDYGLYDFTILVRKAQ